MKTTVKKETTKTVEKVTKKTASKSVITDEAIRQKAYEIYLETGSTDEHANWIKAEKELKKGLKV